MMVRGLLYFIFCSAFVMNISACSADYFTLGESAGDDVVLDIKIGFDVQSQSGVESKVLSYAPGVAVDDEIRSVRVMIFESFTSALPQGYIVLNEFVSGTTNIPEYRFSPGVRDIYVITNEITGMKLGEVRTVDQLKKVLVQYDPFRPTQTAPFVMCGSKLKVDLQAGERHEVKLDLLRVAAKAHLKVSFDRANMLGDFDATMDLRVDSVRVMNIAGTTGLIDDRVPNNPTISTRIDGPLLTVGRPTNRDMWVVEYDLYLNELLFQESENKRSPSNATYIMVYGTISDPIHGNRRTAYRINLGEDVVSTAGSADYTIIRNTEFNVDAKITKPGQMDGIDVTVSIKDWDNKNLDPNPDGRYVKFSYVTTSNYGTIYGSDGYANQSSAVIDDMGGDILVHCSTNCGGWYVVVRESKTGLVVATSDKTPTYGYNPSSGGTQGIKVSIPPMGKYTELTLSIHHPILANQAEFPIWSSPVDKPIRQLYGFLPRSFFYIREGEDLHPEYAPNGMYIAQKGNKLPGSSSAGLEELPCNWDDDESQALLFLGNYRNTDYVGASVLGTPNMLKRLPTTIATKCQELGEGWRVPSSGDMHMMLRLKQYGPFEGTDYAVSYNQSYWTMQEQMCSPSIPQEVDDASKGVYVRWTQTPGGFNSATLSAYKYSVIFYDRPALRCVKYM